MKRAAPRRSREGGGSAPTGNPVTLAMRMLARRPLSEGEVVARLEVRGIAGPEAAIAIARLRDLGLLDDPDLCRRLARSYQEERRYGPAKIARTLAARRFPRGLVEAALREVASPGAVAEAAAQALRKRFREGVPPGRAGGAKAYRFLAGRGFPPDACRAAIGRRFAEFPEGED